MSKITVKAARVNAGLTQEELANKMGVHRSTISSWETNPSTMQIKDAELLCKILNIPISNIFFGYDSTNCWLINLERRIYEKRKWRNHHLLLNGCISWINHYCAKKSVLIAASTISVDAIPIMNEKTRLAQSSERSIKYISERSPRLME